MSLTVTKDMSCTGPKIEQNVFANV